MKVLWYWPTMKLEVEEEARSNRVRYMNCMEATWEPFGERLAWIEKEATMYSWVNVPLRRRSG